jgi:hypothetical protein
MVTSCVFTVEGAGGRDVDEEVEPEDEPDCADDEESNWLVTMEGASSR